ncbi:Meiotic expression up-regulated protein 10 [Smittium culicis]|uniref:Meiotic expression up-regulated protein 10 n=1 Tax=Smittium culicis TaxID=133412 RepID=A0A1R1XNZ7_9FUNG|nr:Meiotic expression up-regulated protein 10 [Smittium culicis]
MKFLVLTISLYLSYVSAQCNSGLIVSSQSDIDSISGCSKIVGNVVISRTSISKVDFTNLEEIEGNVQVTDNASLESLNFEKLKSLSGNLIVEGNNLLTDLKSDLISNVKDIDIKSNPSLSSLNFPKLFQASNININSNKISSFAADSMLNARDISISENDNLKNIEFLKLTSCSGSFKISENSESTDAQLPSLAQVQGDATFENISNLNMTLLSSTGGRLSFKNNEFTDLVLTSLKNVQKNLSITNNKNLKSFSFTELTTIGGDVSISENGQLNSVGPLSLPKLSVVQGKFEASGNINTFVLPGITSIIGGYSLNYSGTFDCNALKESIQSKVNSFKCTKSESSTGSSPQNNPSATGTSSNTSSKSQSSSNSSSSSAGSIVHLSNPLSALVAFLTLAASLY